MSCLHNERILESIFDDVCEMTTSAILIELEGGRFADMCESFEMRCAWTDRDKVIEQLVNKRFEAMPEGPQ